MVAVPGFLHPSRGEVACKLQVILRLRFLAAHLAELSERAEAADRFGAEVHIMREVTGEVVGAKLILWVKALRLQVLGPLFELVPVKRRKISVAFHLRDGAEEQQQVPALLDRHLVLLRALATAVNLPVCFWVSAEIVRRKGKFPTLISGVVHKRHKK